MATTAVSKTLWLKSNLTVAPATELAIPYIVHSKNIAPLLRFEDTGVAYFT